MLFPGAASGDPALALERLRQGLVNAVASASAPALRIAFSAGVTRYRSGESIDGMIERADRGLYAAKRAGRNRTIVLQDGKMP